MRRLIRLALVASVLYGAGAHWAALQTYAWAAMAASGATAPCKVCRLVEKGSVVKQAPAALISAPSADMLFTAPPAMSVALAASPAPAEPPASRSSPASAPAAPPPKPVLPA